MSDEPTLAEVQQVYGQMPTIKEFFYDWAGLNQWLFSAINKFHSTGYDTFMLFVTQLGEHDFIPYYMMVLLVYALLSLIWKKLRRRGGLKQHFLMWLGSFMVMAGALVITVVIVQILKDYMAFPRPYVIVPRAVLIEAVENSDAYRSFPSGHVTFFSIMIFSLWPVLSHHMRLFGLFMIAMVAWSRIALGVHFPADAVWSCLLALLIVYMVRGVLYTLLRKLFGINCGGA